MKKITILSLFFVLLQFIYLYGQLPPDVELGIVNRTKISIAILSFEPRTGVWLDGMFNFEEELFATIQDDLNFSLFFRVIDTLKMPQRRLSDIETTNHDAWACIGTDDIDINLVEWSNIGTDAILFGTFDIEDDEAKLKIKLVSVAFNKVRLDKEYAGNTAQVRRIAHAVSDDIVKTLTGEEGIFQTLVAFVSDRSGEKEVYLCDYDGHNYSQLTNTGTISLYPAWSPDGLKISYTSYTNSNPCLYMVDWTSSKTDELSDFDGLNAFAAWSPDKRKIAYVLTKDGNSEIYVRDIRSGRLTRLTYSWAIDTSPTWSPTGNQLAFTSDRSGTPQIYIMDATGTNMQRLTYSGSYNDLASWCPRGDLIAFTSRNEGHFDIYTIDITGENLSRLTTSKGNDEKPSWSPDGYHIIFASNRLGSYQLYSISRYGGNLRRITNTLGANNTAPAWSPRMNWKLN